MFLYPVVFFKCRVCVSANLKRLQKRNAFNEGLIHPSLLCIIFHNQSVKCGSILKGKQPKNNLFHALCHIQHNATEDEGHLLLSDSPGPTGLRPVSPRLWRLEACCTWEPALQNCPCCHIFQHKCSHRPSVQKYRRHLWKWLDREREGADVNCKSSLHTS